MGKGSVEALQPPSYFTFPVLLGKGRGNTTIEMQPYDVRVLSVMMVPPGLASKPNVDH